MMTYEETDVISNQGVKDFLANMRKDFWYTRLEEKKKIQRSCIFRKNEGRNQEKPTIENGLWPFTFQVFTIEETRRVAK
jgi:hypothetical protein